MDVLRLPESDLSVSVYKDDKEAFDIWKNAMKIPEDRIHILGDDDNFWPANAILEGPNGPCGPCSEIYYKGTEIWNLVFTQFNRCDGGALEPLPGKNIDTGMGLERLARVLQHVNTNFDIDIFSHIRGSLRRLVDVPTAYENLIMDHARAVTFCIADMIMPGNEGRNYVVRKIIRRAYMKGRKSSGRKPFLYKLYQA